jgi:hypothetical protein
MIVAERDGNRLRGTSRWLAIAVLLAPWACSPGAPEFQTLTVDTVEVALVGAYVLAPEPAYILGAAADGGRPGLHIIWGGALLDAGGLLLANEGSTSVLYFDVDGHYLGEVGEVGDEPGQFRRVHGVAVLDDRDAVMVWDRALRRITVLGADRQVEQVVEVAGRRGFLFDRALALGGSGFATVHEDDPGTYPLGFSRQRVTIGVFDGAGKEVAELAVPGRERYGARGANILVPFGHGFLAAGTGRGIFLGSGKEARIVEYDLRGEATRQLRLPIRRETISAQQREERLAASRRSTTPDRWIEALDAAFRADSFPAFSRLISGNDGSLWVRLFNALEPQDEWLVIDPDALEARSITLPERSEVLDASSERVVILLREPSGGPEVRSYTFREVP